MGGYENAQFLTIYLGFEIVYNVFFLVFTILAIILFFNKRTSAPKFMIFFYGTNLALTIVESFVMNQTGLPDPTGASDIIKSIISAAIWIPYFLKSKRVKETFVKNYKNKKKDITKIVQNLEYCSDRHTEIPPIP